MANLKHIAFIIDGNGRWATRRGLPRNMGHRQGVKALERTIEYLVKYNIPFASFYTFSTDNWKRSEEEINGLFSLIEEYFDKGVKFFLERDVKVVIYGDSSAFNDKTRQILENAVEKTKECKTLTAAFCLNYGGREDIVRAVNKLISQGEKEISINKLSENLYSANIPDPDFVVRTSGEKRISNFQIWQMAYSELYFPKVLWPDFNERHFKKMIKVFSKRKRRFGGY